MERSEVQLRIIWKSFILLLFLFPSLGLAEFKEIIAEGTYNMGDGETPTVAEDRALLNAKRIAIEQAGTYIESYSKVKNFRLTADEIQVLASGVMEVVILEKKRTLVGDGLNFSVKIRAKVSGDKVEEMAGKLKDKSFSVENSRLRKEYEELSNEMEGLKKQLKRAKSKGEKKRLEAKITEEEEKFQAKILQDKGWEHIIRGELREAIEVFNKVISFNPYLASAYYDLGFAQKLQAIRDKNHELLNIAIENYTRAISMDPNFIGAFVGRGGAYIEKGLFEKAIEDLNKGIEMKPTNLFLLAMAYVNRGVAHENKDQLNIAIDDYSSAIALNALGPWEGFAYASRARGYFKKGQFDMAIEDYNRAIALNPTDASYYSGRGSVYERKGQYDMAISDFRKGCDMRSEEACKYLDLASKIRSNEYEMERLKKQNALLEQAQTYIENKQFVKAIEALGRAIEMNPNNASVYGVRGTLYEKIGLKDRAVEDYTKSLSLDRNNCSVYVSRGWIYLIKEQFEKAIEDFHMGLAIDPDSKPASKGLASSYAGRGFSYYDKGLVSMAISDFKRACDMGNKEGCDMLRRILGR